MPDHQGGNLQNEVTREEHQHNLQAKRVIVLDGSGGQVTNFGGGEGGGGTAAFANSSDVDKKGLVDADRHVQVDVLTTPTTTVQATNLDIRDLSSVSDSVAVTDGGGSLTVDASSLPLPSGASTAAKQPALGTAGSASADVITVQGVASMTALKTDSSAVTQPVSHAALTELAAAINSDKVDVNIASGSSSGTEYTEGDTDASITGSAIMWEDASDTMRAVSAAKPLPVDLQDTSVAITAAALPLPSGAATSAKQDTIIGHLDGVEGLLTDIEADTDTLAVTGGGVESGALRVTVANDSTGVLSVDDNGGSLTVDNAGLTELAAAINSSKVDVNVVSSDVATGGTSAVDDADFTAGVTSGTPAMGVYESTPTTVTDGDLGTVGITAGRRLKTSSTIDAALPAGTNNIGDVDVLSSALPTGASTSAKQDTVIGHLDGVEGLLTTIDADTGTIAGAVSGSEMQVDIVTSALPTGAATGAKQDTGNTALAAIQTSAELIDDAVRAEDVASADAHKGVVMMAVRQDTPANTSGTDGDYEMPKMAAGRLWVDASGKTLTVDGSGVTQPVSNAGLTELAAAINSDKVDVNISSGNITGFATSAKQDTAQTSLDAIKTATETIDNAISGSEMQVDVVGALPAGTNAIGKLAANSGVDIGDVDITSIATGTNAIGRVGHDITGIGHGVTTVTTAGTDVALAASTACKRVTIQAQTDNTNAIAVGASGVDATVATGTGILLYPGDVFELEIDNLADVFIDSLVNGEGVRYTYFI